MIKTIPAHSLPADKVRNVSNGGGQASSKQHPYKEVARGMEMQFVNNLLNEMRKTINKEEGDSSELDYYHSLMDQEYAKILAHNKDGVGIQQLILDQLEKKNQRVNNYAHQNQNRQNAINHYAKNKGE